MKLQELLAANQPLAMVYAERGVEGIWYAPSVGRMATMAELDAVGEGKKEALLQRFGRNLSKYMRGSGECKFTRCNEECAEG